MIIVTVLLNRGEPTGHLFKKESIESIPLSQDLKHCHYFNGTLKDWVSGSSILYPQFPDETFAKTLCNVQVWACSYRRASFSYYTL